MALCAWITFGLLDFGLMIFVGAYAAGLVAMYITFPMLNDTQVDSLPFPLHSLAKRFDVVDWFGFEFRAFIARILLFAFVVTCVAGLIAVGLSEELALVAALSILALSLPTYLIYYTLSKDRKGEAEETEN